MHAIFGGSPTCVAVHPSDMAVALMALDAELVTINSVEKKRKIPLKDYYVSPALDPSNENSLHKDEIITQIIIPKNKYQNTSSYLKIRDRSSYAFALVSVAVAMELSKKGKIKKIRIALGGVAYKPWRAYKAEEFLEGKIISTENFSKAATLQMEDAVPLKHNVFKIDMGKRAIVRALSDACKEV